MRGKRTERGSIIPGIGIVVSESEGESSDWFAAACWVSGSGILEDGFSEGGERECLFSGCGELWFRFSG